MQGHSTNIKPLFIGHVSCDMIDGKCALGGAVSFASKWAVSQGIYPVVITSCAAAYKGLETLKSWNVKLINQVSSSTTSFTNIYMGNERTQFVSARGDKIKSSTIGKQASEADFIFLAPIAQEIDPAIMKHLPKDRPIACSIQGWLRNWDDEGKVRATEMDWSLLAYADFVFLSYEDLEGLPEALEKLLALDTTIIITDNANGCDVFIKTQKTHYAAPQVEVVNPTGAGDTFATAFLVKYFETKSIEAAAEFANSAASKFISSSSAIH